MHAQGRYEPGSSLVLDRLDLLLLLRDRLLRWLSFLRRRWLVELVPYDVTETIGGGLRKQFGEI